MPDSRYGRITDALVAYYEEFDEPPSAIIAGEDVLGECGVLGLPKGGGYIGDFTGIALWMDDRFESVIVIGNDTFK